MNENEKEVEQVLKKILLELIQIKKELQAIRSSLEQNYKIDSEKISKKLKEIGMELNLD